MEQMWITVLSGVVSGGVLVAIIEGVKEALVWRRNRKAQLEDRADEKEDKAEKLKEAVDALTESQKTMSDEVSALIVSSRLMMLDRIRHLGLSYINRGWVSYEERKMLHDMHDSYHFGLNGNGDADLIIEGVDELPLK